ncbi:ABC-three component system protein [Pararhodobacter zhoushanensis]|uniref:ABC-three component system protein n=1 Tax=Pararhodobacter zhoushanensis TaxID=2479545 RepID=UPI000F8CEB11|nr:ABC-three component system protein [Pararhodobacter zhoushanensis]
MIRTVSSSLASFKPITFGSGLNIVLADVAEASTDRHTRNSAGKTSLVEIINFVLGGEAAKKTLFKHDALIEQSFSIEILLGDRWVTATRKGADDNIVQLSIDDAEALGITVPVSLFDDAQTQTPVSIETWKSIIGSYWFDLPINRDDTEFSGKGAPSFRQLIGYFVRRRKAGGFETIEKNTKEQQPGSWQVSLSYLLGLNWHVARQFQDMRDRKKVVAALKKAINNGELGDIFGATAQIRPELARVEKQMTALRLQVDNFVVHESYRKLALQASKLKDRLNEITLELSEANSALDYLAKSVAQESPPAYTDIERLYQMVGVELPNVAMRRFEDVKAFQASVTANRQQYLYEQINEIRERRDILSKDLDDEGKERSDILRSLAGKGAFDDLVRLQEELGKYSARAEMLRSKLQHAAVLENNRVQLKAESAELELKLQQSLADSDSSIKRATVLVDQAISELYDDRTGNLIIAPSRLGPQIRIDIQGGGNKGGIDMMKIFCFDTALLCITAERFRYGPRLIIHDSHLFDGVDSRQVSQALVYGDKVANAVSGQYIVALNSDEFRSADSLSDISLLPFVNVVKLTDDETGGLFGFRFDLEGQADTSIRK